MRTGNGIELKSALRCGVLAVGVALALTTSAAAAELQDWGTWTDTTGKFALETEFVAIKNGNVVLMKKDGSEISLLLEKLSRADPEHAALAAAADAGAAPAAGVAAGPGVKVATGTPGSWTSTPTARSRLRICAG